jgi:integrase
VAILEAMRVGGMNEGTFIFPGRYRRKPLSDTTMVKLLHRMGRLDLTVHGFRSTFRDWAAECTNFSREVAEMALAHTVGDRVEAAYRRGDLFNKRRQMMEAWAKHCEPGRANVVAFAANSRSLEPV